MVRNEVINVDARATPHELDLSRNQLEAIPHLFDTALNEDAEDEHGEHDGGDDEAAALPRDGGGAACPPTEYASRCAAVAALDARRGIIITTSFARYATVTRGV